VDRPINLRHGEADSRARELGRVPGHDAGPRAERGPQGPPGWWPRRVLGCGRS